MKAALFSLLALPVWCAAQPFAMLDRNLRHPVEVQQGFGLSDIASGAFPLYLQDVDAVVYCLDTLARKIHSGTPVPAVLEAAVSPHCTILMWHRSSGSQDVYNGVLRVSNGNIIAPLSIGEKTSRKLMVRRLKQLADYLRNNGPLLQ